jgi:hypothetical protein
MYVHVHARIIEYFTDKTNNDIRTNQTSLEVITVCAHAILKLEQSVAQ